MQHGNKDIVIIGGGLAGLSLAILTSRVGKSVLLIEKGAYPKHKVCGEYISLESKDFLLKLGVDITALQLPIIDTFVLTSHHGLKSTCALNPGGVGISRYKLDARLAQVAIDQGVELIQNERVTNVEKVSSNYIVKTAQGNEYQTKQVVGAYGRVSGLSDSEHEDAKTHIGVKYHLNSGPAQDVIEIHNFKGGYAGISAIEDGKYCLCYLAKAEGLKAYKGDIASYEKEILWQNPYLKQRLQADKLIAPVVTSQLVFGVNNADSLDYPLLGDAAGFIPPITGNGMSLAFRSASNLFEAMTAGNDLMSASKEYTNRYLKERINKGIFLQDLLFVDNTFFNKSLMYAMAKIPGLMNIMTKQAVGHTI